MTPAPTRHDIAKARRLLKEAKAELERVPLADAGEAWAFWLGCLRRIDTLRIFMPRVIPDLDEIIPSDSVGFTSEPAEHPVDQYSRRAMEAIKRAFAEEFPDGELAPHVTLVCAMPPDGRVAIATTEQDPDDALAALKAGWGAIHHAWRLQQERAARQ